VPSVKEIGGKGAAAGEQGETAGRGGCRGGAGGDEGAREEGINGTRGHCLESGDRIRFDRIGTDVTSMWNRHHHPSTQRFE
jgi:hypothetical protein